MRRISEATPQQRRHPPDGTSSKQQAQQCGGRLPALDSEPDEAGQAEGDGAAGGSGSIVSSSTVQSAVCDSSNSILPAVCGSSSSGVLPRNWDRGGCD